MSNWLDTAPCGYLSFSDDGSIVYANQTLCTWLGYGSDELTGKKIDAILTVATRIFYQTHFFPLLKLNSKAEEIFLSLRGKDKNDIPVLTSAERRLEDTGYINHCALIAIFERQKYEEEILKARREAETALKENKYLEALRRSLEKQTLELDREYQKQLTLHANLTQFNKIVSHDLQEPIRKISLFTGMLMRELGDAVTEKGRVFANKITIAVQRLNSITTGLHQYLTAEADQTHAEVDLNAVLEQVQERVREARQIDELNMSYIRLPVIQGYHTQLELLFYHLIDNAVQFKYPARPLQINITWVLTEENLFKLEKEKYRFAEHIRITVSDNGIGFENEYKEYVKVLLNKMNPSTEGLGIGLSIIKKVVDNHAGSFIIDAVAGQGTTFSILLPTKLYGSRS